MRLNVTGIVRRECTAQCSFQFDFGNSIERPKHCSQRILSYTCVTRIIILYSTHQIFVHFRTTGLEENENEIALYTVQQVSHIFQRNHSSYVILFGCFFADNCDWTYTSNIIDRFTRIDYTSMFNELKSLLYENSNTSVSQCFSDNDIVDCNHGQCLSILFEGSLHINRSCHTSSDVNLGIDIRHYRGFPQTSDDDRNYHFYVCNRQLCNDPTTEHSVQAVIQSYSSIFDISQPSKTMILQTCTVHYFIVVILSLLFTK